MTAYESGFLEKCGSLGVKKGDAIGLLKLALSGVFPENPYGRQFFGQKRRKLTKNELQPMKNLSRPMLEPGKLVNDVAAKAVEKGNRAAGTLPKPPKTHENVIPKSAVARILKISESDPNLQRASALFKDWLTTRKHVVRPGEVLAGIARRYGVPLEDVMEENGMTSVLGIRPGQQIRIPVMQAKTAQASGSFSPFRSRSSYVSERNQILRNGTAAALAGLLMSYYAQDRKKETRKRVRNAILAAIGLGGAAAVGTGIANHMSWVSKYRGTGRTPFGFTMFGSGSFDPKSEIPVVRDRNGRPTISVLFRGIQGHVDTGTRNAMFGNGSPLDKIISEQVSGAIAYSRNFSKYIDRIRAASDKWAREHNGERPLIRLYGHSMGASAALKTQKRLEDAGLKVDGTVGIAPAMAFGSGETPENSNGRVAVRPAKNVLDSVLSRFDTGTYDDSSAAQIQTDAKGHTDTEKLVSDAVDYITSRDNMWTGEDQEYKDRLFS